MQPSVNLLSDVAVAGEVTVRHGGTSRVEAFNAADTLVAVLARREFVFDRSADAVRLRDSGLAMSPRVMGIHVLPDGRCQTICTVTVRHPSAFPDALFEYQHATGRTISGALATGFADWIDTDLDVLIEAVTGRVERCTLLDVVVPATADRPARVRRAFIGPVEQRGSSAGHPAQVPTEGAVHGPSLAIIRSPEAFAPELEGDQLFGIRFYCLRPSDRPTGADCRVNGRDHAAGRAAALRYARAWPGRGPRAEKQYVVIRDAQPLAREEPA